MTSLIALRVNEIVERRDSNIVMRSFGGQTIIAVVSTTSFAHAQEHIFG